MSSVNKVILIGRLGADPEIRSTNNGTKVANLRIATSETWRDKDTGERKEKTEWHTVTVWNEGLVKLVEQYTNKGDRIYIEGKLETRKWQDQDGKDRFSTAVVLQGFNASIVLLGEGNGGGDRDDNNDDRGSSRDDRRSGSRNNDRNDDDRSSRNSRSRSDDRRSDDRGRGGSRNSGDDDRNDDRGGGQRRSSGNGSRRQEMDDEIPF